MDPILEKRKKINSKQLPKVEKLPEEYFLDYLRDDEWMAKLAYLVDIFDLLNTLNLQSQGRNANCFQFYGKVEAFKKNLSVWKQELVSGELIAFPLSNH